MRASLRATAIGGLVALCSLFGTAAGPARGDPASPPPDPAAPSAEPAVVVDDASIKANPDCKAPDIGCAWSHCYPRNDRWHSISACITDSCHIEDKACMLDLISDLYDSDRQKAHDHR